jgi:hypothetical protein
MLATPEEEMAGTMSLVSLTDNVAIALEQRSAQLRTFIVETHL